MIVEYRNNQDKSDPQHGMVFADSASLSVLLDGARTKPPFIAELRGNNGFELVIGIGGDFGFVEHLRINGDLPYLMAVSPRPPVSSGYIEFLTANTPTPIPAHEILRFSELKQIALHFLTTGARSDAVSWVSI